MAVVLLYQLGEGAPEEALKPGTGILSQLATGHNTQPYRAAANARTQMTLFWCLVVAKETAWPCAALHAQCRSPCALAGLLVGGTV